jgi:hypothetical protein
MWPRYGIIIDKPNTSYPDVNVPSTEQPPTPSASSNGRPSFGGGGSTGGAVGNGMNNTVNFSNMEVKYYKIDLSKTQTNMYGESLEKWYYSPISVKCLIERSNTTSTDDEFGITMGQTVTLTIPVDFAHIYDLLPENGDIIMDRERYYEINNVDENFTTISGASTPNGTQGTVGQTTSYQLTGYLTRITRLNIIPYNS